MKPIDMTNFRGKRKDGVDYSMALRDMLPALIGPGCTPKSKREIATATGRNFETVTRIFERMAGQLHIAGWRRGRTGNPTALWMLGAGEDVPMPHAFTQAEKSKRYRATPEGKAISRAASDRWKQTEAGKLQQAAYNEVRKQRYRIKVAAKRRAAAVLKAADPLMAAIMGRSA